MFERFTDRARRVVVLAQEEARVLDHNHIGTEHVLLGLVHEGDGVGARALVSLGISLDEVRAKVGEIIGDSAHGPLDGHIPFTPRAKKALELSLREALQLGHDYIGTEHILLGLVREGEGVAAQVLVKLGVDLRAVRAAVLSLLAGGEGAAEGEPVGGKAVEGVDPRPHQRRQGIQRIFAVGRRDEAGGFEDVVAGTRTPLEELAHLAASPSTAGAELRAAGIVAAALLGTPEPRVPAPPNRAVAHLAETLARAIGGPAAVPGDDHVLVVLLSPHPWDVADVVAARGGDPAALRRSALARL